MTSSRRAAYVARSTSIGSALAARNAGERHAPTVTASRIVSATTRVAASVG